MAFEYRIDKDQSLVFMRFRGILDDENLLEAFNDIYANPDYVPVMDQCIDYSDISELLITRLGIDDLVVLCTEFDCLSIKWKTIIVAPDDLSFAYGRMYEIMSGNSNEEISVVRSIASAMKLLAISLEEYPFKQQNSDMVCSGNKLT